MEMDGVDDQKKNLEEGKIRFSVTLENRYDSLELSDKRNPQELENAGDIPGQSKLEPSLSDSLEPERPRGTGNYNLRKSLAWDSAFFTSKGVLDPENDDFELFDTGNSLELENAADIFGQREHEYLPSDSLEPEIPSRDGKFNLRQSLAWDSAFFTSEGVLDPEELFMINKGFKKAKTRLLPGIKEELQRSAESNSTIDSDRFSLESLEIDLFEDIRASIQKSTSEKLDAACQTRMKTTPAITRQTINVHGSQRTAKEISIHTRVQATGSRESIPLPLKPPKMLGQSNSISAAPTKRVPLGANRVEVENRNAKTTLGKRLVVTRQPCLVNSCSIIPSSTPSPRSSSGSATATNKSTVSCSPYDRSDSASSDATGKSPSNSLRRKIDSRSINLATSVSTLKTPLRCSTKTKNDVRNSGHSSSRFSSSLSAQKPSSCTSSTSSFDGWSSESSSSTVNQRSNGSKASLDGAPYRGFSFDNDIIQASDIESHPPNQSSVGSKSHRTRLPNQYIKKCSMVNGPVSPNVSGNSKPSSLRMPSPKIGFFDVEKSMPTGLNGSFQFRSGAQSTLAKSGSRISNLSGAANRARRGKLQPARTSIGTQNVKRGSHQTEVSCPDSGMNPAYPVQFHNVEDASKKGSGLLRTTRSHLGMTVKNQNVSSTKVSRENCSKTPEVGSSSKAENKGAQAVLKDRMRRESKGTVHVKANKTLTKEGRTHHSRENMNLQRKEHEEVSQNCPQDNQSLLHMNEKENYFEDQVDGLSRQVSVIDLSRDVVVEPRGNVLFQPYCQ